MTGGWTIEHSHGDAAAFHARDPEPRRTATFHTVERPTLVLGSSQPPGDADHRVAAALGVEVVSRRSGGGAVLLLPGEFVWLDLVVPAGDPLWHDDIGRAMVWAGECWQRALADCGVESAVHEGAMTTTTWSRQVCFAGVGTGEVLAAARAGAPAAPAAPPVPPAAPAPKYVGISQRRTRSWIRLQTMCHLVWRPEVVAALVAAPRPAAADLAGVAAPVPAPAGTLTAALVAHLPS